MFVVSAVIATAAALAGAALGAVLGVVRRAARRAGGGGDPGETLDPNPAPFAIAIGAIGGLVAGTVLAVVFTIKRLGRPRHEQPAAADSGSAEVAQGKWSRPSRRTWLIGATLSSALIWLRYTPSLVFPGPSGESSAAQRTRSLSSSCRGTRRCRTTLLSNRRLRLGRRLRERADCRRSWSRASRAAVAAGWRRPQRRLPTALAFVAGYAVALVALWNVAPDVWGPVTFLTD